MTWYSATMRPLLALLAFLPTLALADVTGPARAIDGDTIEVGWERGYSTLGSQLAQ